MDTPAIDLRPAHSAAHSAVHTARPLHLLLGALLIAAIAVGCGPAASNNSEPPLNNTPAGVNNQEPAERDDRPGSVTVCNLTPVARTLTADRDGEPIEIAPWAIYRHELSPGDHTLAIDPPATDANPPSSLAIKIEPACRYFWELSNSRHFSIVTYRLIGGALIELVRTDRIPHKPDVPFTSLVITTHLGLLDPIPTELRADAASSELAKIEMTDRWIADVTVAKPEDWPDPGFVERALFHDFTAYSPRQLIALLVDLPDTLADRRAEAVLSLMRSGDPRLVDAATETYLVEFPCSDLNPQLRNLLGPDLRAPGESRLFARAALRVLARSMLRADLAQLWTDTVPDRRRFLFDSIKGVDGYSVARLYTDLVTRDLDAGDAAGPPNQYFLVEAAAAVMQPDYLQYTDVFRRLRDHFNERFEQIPQQEFAARRQALEAIAELYGLGLRAAKMRIASGDPIPYDDVATLCRGALQLPNEYREGVDVAVEAWRVAIELLAQDYDKALPIFIEDWAKIKNTTTRRDIIFRVREASARSRLISLTHPDLLRLYRLGVVETEPDTRRWAFNGLALPANMGDESLRELLRGVITVETDDARKRDLTAIYETSLVRYLATQPWESAADPLFKLITTGQIGGVGTDNPGAIAYHVAIARLNAAVGDDAEALATMRGAWLQRLLDAMPSAGETNRAALVYNLSRDLPDGEGFTLAMGALADESAVVREVAGTLLLEHADWASRDGVEEAVAQAATGDGDNEALRGRLAVLEVARLEPLASTGDAAALDALAAYLTSELPGVAERAVIAFRFLVHVEGAGERVGIAFGDVPTGELKRDILSFASQFRAVPWAIFETSLASAEDITRRAAAFGLVGLAREGNALAQQLLHDAAETETNPDLKTLMGQW